MKNNSKQIRQTIDNIVSAASRLSLFLHDGTVTPEHAHLYLSDDFMRALHDLLSEVERFCNSDPDISLAIKVKKAVVSVFSGEDHFYPDSRGSYNDSLIGIIRILRCNDMVDDEDLPDFFGISSWAKTNDRSMEEFYNSVFSLFCGVKCLIMEYMNNLLPSQLETHPELFTPEVMALWTKLQAKGIINENFMPINLSQNQAAIVAYRMIAFLKPAPSWKAFEDLWNIDNLSTKLVRSKDANYYHEFCQYIDNMLK